MRHAARGSACRQLAVELHADHRRRLDQIAGLDRRWSPLAVRFGRRLRRSFRRASRQKNAGIDHCYGHQRFETAASLMLGALPLGRWASACCGRPSASWKSRMPRRRPHRRVVGVRRGADGQGTVVARHAIGGQARQVQHARRQRVARTLGCGIAGGGHRHRRQPGGLPESSTRSPRSSSAPWSPRWGGALHGMRCTILWTARSTTRKSRPSGPH